MPRIQVHPLAALTFLAWANVADAQSPCGGWNPVTLPGASSVSLASVAAGSGTDVWAVGKAVYHWDGMSWTLVPAPGLGNPDPLGYADTVFAGVAALPSGDAWIVGYTSFLGTPQTLIEHWNGSAWSVIPSPVIAGGSGLDAVSALNPNDAWAVGYRAGGLPEFAATRVTLTVHWNGSSWTAVPSPNISNRSHELQDVLAIAADDVWAVGYYRNIGELYKTLVLHWDGANWSIIPSFNYPGENILYGVSASSSNDVWMVGGAWDGIVNRQIFLHWDGSSLSEVTGPGGPTVCAGCTGDVLAMGPNDVWAVGSNIGHWDGVAWSLVPNPNVPGSIGIALRSLARVGTCDAWSVGSSFDEANMDALSVRLTGGGGTVNQPPVVLATSAPASGYAPLTVQFSSADSYDPDGTIVSYLWNFGDSSYPPNRTDPNPVHTYLQTGPLVYHATLQVVDNEGAVAETSVRIDILNQPPVAEASGTNTTGTAPLTVHLSSAGSHDPDGTITSYHWDFGDGTSPANQNDPAPSHIYTVSGPATLQVTLTITDDHDAISSASIPIVITGAVLDVGPETRYVTRIVEVTPNPSRRDAAVLFELSSAAPTTLKLFDIRGRLVATLADGVMGPGRHERSLGAGFPAIPGAGIYFLQLNSGGVTLAAKLVVLD